jgi:ATP-binding cassette subfamily B protein
VSEPPESAARRRDRLAKLAAKGRESAHLTWRTIGLVYRSWPAATLLLGGLTVAVAGLPLAIAWVGKEIVDAVVAGSREDAIRWVVTELAIVAVHATVQRGIGLTRELLGERLGLDINNAILDKAQALELRHFEDGKFYDSLTRARREASYRPVSVVTEGFQLVQNSLTFAGYVALIVGYSPIAALVLLGAAVP